MTYENGPQGPVWGPQGSQGPQQGYYQQPPQQPKKKKGKGKWIVLIVVLLLILGFCAVNSGDDDSGTASSTTTSDVAPAPGRARHPVLSAHAAARLVHDLHSGRFTGLHASGRDPRAGA